MNEHSPMPLLADLLVAVGGCWSRRRSAGAAAAAASGSTRRGAPICQYLPVGLVLVLGPRADDVAERLAPHLARLVGVDAEALELGARRRAAGAEVDAAVGDEVEHRDRLRGADRVVVRLRAAGARRSRCGCSRCAPRSRRRAPRGSSSASTPRGSGARPSRTRGSPSGRRASPARACSCTPGAPCPGSTAGRPGSRRTARTSRADLRAGVKDRTLTRPGRSGEFRAGSGMPLAPSVVAVASTWCTWLSSCSKPTAAAAM